MEVELAIHINVDKWPMTANIFSVDSGGWNVAGLVIWW
jgi:hypothetical protein